MSNETRRRSILIVDDDPALLQMLEDIFTFLGWDVLACPYAHMAINAIQDHNPDIALVDVMLGDMRGTELVRQVRAAGYDLPVMIMTGNPCPAFMAEALTARVDAFIEKPFLPATIAEQAQSLVDAKRAA